MLVTERGVVGKYSTITRIYVSLLGHSQHEDTILYQCMNSLYKYKTVSRRSNRCNGNLCIWKDFIFIGASCWSKWAFIGNSLRWVTLACSLQSTLESLTPGNSGWPIAVTGSSTYTRKEWHDWHATGASADLLQTGNICKCKNTRTT